MYLSIYEKIWATIRHELYKMINEEKGKLNLPTDHGELPEKVWAECYNKIHDNFEEYR